MTSPLAKTLFRFYLSSQIFQGQPLYSKGYSKLLGFLRINLHHVLLCSVYRCGGLNDTHKYSDHHLQV